MRPRSSGPVGPQCDFRDSCFPWDLDMEITVENPNVFQVIWIRWILMATVYVFHVNDMDTMEIIMWAQATIQFFRVMFDKGVP